MDRPKASAGIYRTHIISNSLSHPSAGMRDSPSPLGYGLGYQPILIPWLW